MSLFHFKLDLFHHFIKQAHCCIRVLLSFSLLYAFNFGFITPAQAEVIATFSSNEADSQLESTHLIASLGFSDSTTLLPGLENLGLNPFIASDEFLTSNEAIGWYAANTTLALVLVHIYNQQGQTFNGLAVAGGMILIVPLVSWLLLMGGFLVSFTCGGGFTPADCTIPYGIAGVFAAGAILLPIAAFFLGLSWLPSQSKITPGATAMTEPALNMQLLRF